MIPRLAPRLLVALAAAIPLPSLALGADASPFPPLPGPDALQAAGEAEREAGAVILEREVHVEGHVDVRFASAKGWVQRRNRVRYLVLDARGAEQLARHAFFGEMATGTSLIEIRGRTVRPGGEIVPLDPDKDVRDLDVKDVRGRTRKAGRTAFFPQVEPGAILDLAWSERAESLPSLEIVELQGPVPTRSLRVTSKGLLVESSLGKAAFLGGATQQWYWVPFFTGPTPPRARATLDEDLDLDLECAGLEPAPAEPESPPRYRSTYTLGLIPEGFALTKKRSLEDWHRNLVLFGSPASIEIEKTRTSITRDLDPAQGMIRIDERGLQILPDWGENEEMLAFFQQGLRRNQDDIASFLKRSSGAETPREVLAIAPESLTWKERARLLYRHARSRVRPDPEAGRENSLAKVLKEGKGHRFDVALYLVHLLRTAGIPVRMVLAFSRYGLAFQPIIDSWRPFDAATLVEAGPAGVPPIYLAPGDPFAGFESFNDRFLGALAFRQPEEKDEPWPLVRIPADHPVSETTELAFTSRLAPDSTPVDLSLRTTLHDSAAMWFRSGLGWPSEKEKSEEPRKVSRAVLERWVDSWTGLPPPADLPVLDPLGDPEAPFVFDVATTWTPEIQVLGSEILVPALPKAAIFASELAGERRSQPLWLTGGRVDLSFTWKLSPGLALLETPPPAQGEGPGGLSFDMKVAASARVEGGPEPSVTTRMIVDLPRMLPATDYAAVKAFWEELQKTSATRLLVSKGAE